MKKVAIILSFFALSLASCSTNFLNKYEAYDNASKYHIINENGEAFENIENISLDWVKGSVDIYYSNEYEYITIYEKANEIINDDFKCHLYQDDNILNIRYCKSNISMPSTHSKKIEIYIPNTLKLKEVEIDNISSSINVDAINCEKLDVDNISGLINLKQVVSTEIVYEGVSGNLNLDVSNETRDIEIEQVSGNTIMSLSENHKGFILDGTTISGNINIDFITTYTEEKFIYNDIKNLSIDFDSVSGNLSVLKRK